MLYSKDDILTAVREELAEANKALSIADGFTDNDYHYLGVIAAAWERLLIRLPNGSKPHVSGALPCYCENQKLGQEFCDKTCVDADEYE